MEKYCADRGMRAIKFFDKECPQNSTYESYLLCISYGYILICVGRGKHFSLVVDGDFGGPIFNGVSGTNCSNSY